MGQDVKLEHRLAAIMATDVVGYSRLIQTDEAGTLAALSEIRNAIENQINQNRGRIVNTAGDSVLAEFASAVEAVACAIAIQQALAKRDEKGSSVQVRIGIHMGDVVSKSGDLFGMAVNIAARLEGIAQPGAIVVSSAVRDDVVGKLVATFADLGMQTLKNIEQPVRVFSVSGPNDVRPAGHPRNSLPLPDKPSIAVLPFENLSADREQEYFADGMVAEIITALSRMRWLFVIARHSSFTYKGRAVDMKQIGRELGVRYILEGSVRKAGNKMRIAGQLIDTSTGAHLWADRFEGEFRDIFEVQDQVATSVVGAITPRLEEAEIERAKRKPTENLDAYDYYLRGLAFVGRMTRDGNDEALQMFSKAIEHDPDFALAYARAAHCYVIRKANGWMTNQSQEITETARLARLAVNLGKDDAVALSFGGYALGYVVGDLDDCAAFVDQALTLNPNLAVAWATSGWIKICFGNPDTAITDVSHALRLSPLDPRKYSWQHYMALAHLCAGRYDDAGSWAAKALRNSPDNAGALRVAAASHALAGRMTEAQQAMARMRQLYPTLCVSRVAEILPPFRRLEDRDKYVEGLRLAGLPE
jgi:TolB-like protein/class 3 adenylate cyclase/Tfp pilus assembly protein PilF